MADGVSRQDVLSILDKMDVDYTPKITLSRAGKKLIRFVDKHRLPKDLSPSEKETLRGLGVEIPGGKKGGKKTAAKKKATTKKAPAKTAKKKATTKKAPAKATTKKAPAKEKKVKKERVDWMTAATRALKQESNIAKAEELAMKLYLDAGGRDVPKIRDNATNNVSRARRVMVELGVGELSEDKETFTVNL